MAGDAPLSPRFGPPLRMGGWCLRLAGPGDIAALRDLRARAFGRDADGDCFDADALHLHLGCDAPGAPPLATARLWVHGGGGALLRGYTGTVYDLGALAGRGGVSLELGRLCTEPGQGGADLLRLIWAGVARLALASGAARLVGCTSFAGIEPPPAAALSLLSARHLGPKALRPGRKAPETLPLPETLMRPAPGAADGQAISGLPPLLRAYLALGAWVGDHLVIDRDLDTCHIFTCLDIAAMPAARRHTLARLAAANAERGAPDETGE